MRYWVLVTLLAAAFEAAVPEPQAALAADGNGGWVFVDIQPAAGGCEFDCITSADDGLTWRRVAPPETRTAHVESPCIARGADGALCLVWLGLDNGGGRTIQWAVREPGADTWGSTTDVQAVPPERRVRKLQVREAEPGVWEVSSVQFEITYDGAPGWFQIVRLDEATPEPKCRESQLPRELVGAGALGGAAWLPREGGRWYVGTVAVPFVRTLENGPRFVSSMYDASSNTWSPIEILRVDGKAVSMAHEVHLAEGANGEMILVSGMSHTPSGFPYFYPMHRATSGGGNHVPLEGEVVFAASLAIPWYVDSGLGQLDFRLLTRGASAGVWQEHNVLDSGMCAFVNPGRGLSDGAGGWLFAVEYLGTAPLHRIVIMRRAGEGENWTCVETDCCPAEHGSNAVRLLHLEQAPSGTCLLVYELQETQWDGVHTYACRSTDFGETWSAPVMLPD